MGIETSWVSRRQPFGKSGRSGLSIMRAVRVDTTLVPPAVTTTEPLACLASFPVSNSISVPPISSETRLTPSVMCVLSAAAQALACGAAMRPPVGRMAFFVRSVANPLKASSGSAHGTRGGASLAPDATVAAQVDGAPLTALDVNLSGRADRALGLLAGEGPGLLLGLLVGLRSLEGDGAGPGLDRGVVDHPHDVVACRIGHDHLLEVGQALTGGGHRLAGRRAARVRPVDLHVPVAHGRRPLDPDGRLRVVDPGAARDRDQVVLVARGRRAVVVRARHGAPARRELLRRA